MGFLAGGGRSWGKLGAVLGRFVGSLLGGCRGWGCFVGVLLIFFFRALGGLVLQLVTFAA